MKGSHDMGGSGHKMGGSMGGNGHNSMGSGSSFMTTKAIDGYDVSFHVMKASDGMQHGGSHNLMVKIEQGGAVISGLVVNSKVIHPDGSEETKPLMKMGDWLSNGYDLGHEGEHQLMVLFKTSDGKKHFGGVKYPQ